MGFKKFIKRYLLRESVKEIELNRILDKVSKKSGLDNREKKFLDLYSVTSDDDMKDYMYLSRNTTFKKIRELLDKNKTVICNLYDKNGKIGVKITDIENDFEDEEGCSVTLKNGEESTLHDKFLYNILYNDRKDEYSLEIQDEYYEKIPVKNDDKK